MPEKLNQPIYSYKMPMFDVGVSTVLIVDNGVVLIEENKEYRFPGGSIRAGQETIQFAAVRYVKELVGIRLTKEALIPVDFRSEPERSIHKNEIDIGMVCLLPDHADLELNDGARWFEIDFENKCPVKKKNFYMDHDLLLERAIDVALMIKED